VVFELQSVNGHWVEKVLHSFLGGTDSANPSSDLVFDRDGNLYGATQGGGGSAYCYGLGCGTVFELSPIGNSWSYSVLHAFLGARGDGTQPFISGRLSLDTKGNLYGTTVEGGTHLCDQNEDGCGTVFELSHSDSWSEKLYDFSQGAGGNAPLASVTLKGGKLFGTAAGGGIGDGTVFQLSRVNGVVVEDVLHMFTHSDGSQPNSDLVSDAAGNFYGTALGGGNDGCIATSPSQGCGVVFKLTPSSGGWTETTLYSFKNDGNDGFWPNGTLVLDAAGNLYGTTFFTSGSNGQWGTIYEITP